ncbi:hypothetical protein PTSG_07237 [Salpingoeca rosetta]|uniref:Hydroxylysine kinase n=1 Tax=Salpingoeca rosetta (strain ATCC 50818 / BSB-021) TaxID=946362 RepID=F2UEG3_SALR5|nr:uncharacterized protein PTSG_07237 [Salpingoeca rosetta]EGD75013.1 hypothetical protein PTSG_07237 [Salpingoeca rosetta]|eukprot:XP_004992657.1 hypothetical protein PTSG_07237 [Salpingoeca rosetta]
MSEEEILRKALKPPKVDSALIVQLCQEEFGLENATVEKEFDSYDDRNYLISATRGSFVFKVHNGADSRPERETFLDAQNKLLLHLHKNKVAAPVPLPLASNPNQHIIYKELQRPDGKKVRHGIRLLAYLPGKLMCEVEHTDAVLADLGASLARMDLALQSFDHPGCHRVHLWDLQHLSQLHVFLPHITDDSKRALATKVMERYEAQVPQLASALPSCVLQNDANDHNIVMSEDGSGVSGFLDFGDVVHSWRINELAICIAYACLEKSDLQHVASTIGREYQAILPLTPAELSLLHTLTAARLCQSCIMSAYSFSQDPTNTYLLVTAAPGWQALQALVDMDDAQVKAFNFGHAPPAAKHGKQA